MALTIEQTYSLARASQRVENAAEAITLTNNPAVPLTTALDLAIADFLRIAGGGSVLAPGAFNFKQTNLSNWRAARAAGAGRVLCVGDSTTAGIWSNGSFNVDGVVKSYPTQFTTLLNGAAVPASAHSFMGGHNIGTVAQATAFDPRLAAVGDVSTDINVGVLGGDPYVLNTTGVLKFTPTGPVDTYDVFYATKSGLGGFVASFDGAPGGLIVATGSAEGVGKSTVRGTFGQHTLTLTANNTGVVYVIGIVAYTSAARTLDVVNAGWSGGKITNMANAVNGWSSANAIPAVAPALTVIDCTINDWLNATPIADYTVAMQALITKAKASGDVVLMIGPPTGGTVNAAQVAGITGANYGLASQNNLPVFDVPARWGSYAAANARGFYGAGEVVHPSALGYGDIASGLTASLLAV